MNVMIHTEVFRFYPDWCLSVIRDLQKRGHTIFRTVCADKRHWCYTRQCMMNDRCNLEECHLFIMNFGRGGYHCYDKLVPVSVQSQSGVGSGASEFESGSMKFAVLGCQERLKHLEFSKTLNVDCAVSQGLALIDSLESAIKENHIDIMLTFNGSFWESWAGICAAKRCGIDIYCWESWDDGYVHWMSKNGTMHDPKALMELAKNFSDVTDEDISEYMSKQINHKGTGDWKPDPHRINVCALGSFQPEHKYEPSRYPFFRTGTSEQDTEQLRNLLGDEYSVTYCPHPEYVKYLGGKGDFNCHDILSKCDIAVAFGYSSPAIATWLGKPVIALFPCNSEGMVEGVRTAYSVDECAKWIKQGVAAVPRQNLRNYVKFNKGVLEWKFVLSGLLSLFLQMSVDLI